MLWLKICKFILIAICINSFIYSIIVILLFLTIALNLWVLINFSCHSIRSFNVERHTWSGRCIRAGSFHWDKLVLSPSIFKSKFFILILDIYWFISIVFILSNFSILLNLIILLIRSCTCCFTSFTLMNDCWIFTIHYICLVWLRLNPWFLLRYFSNLRKYFFLWFRSFRFTAFFIRRNTPLLFLWT